MSLTALQANSGAAVNTKADPQLFYRSLVKNSSLFTPKLKIYLAKRNLEFALRVPSKRQDADFFKLQIQLFK